MLASTDDTCDTMLDIASYNAIMLYKILGFSICSSECPGVLRLLHNVTEIIPRILNPRGKASFSDITTLYSNSSSDLFLLKSSSSCTLSCFFHSPESLLVQLVVSIHDPEDPHHVRLVQVLLHGVQPGLLAGLLIRLVPLSSGHPNSSFLYGFKLCDALLCTGPPGFTSIQ